MKKYTFSDVQASIKWPDGSCVLDCKPEVGVPDSKITIAYPAEAITFPKAEGGWGTVTDVSLPNGELVPLKKPWSPRTRENGFTFCARCEGGGCVDRFDRWNEKFTSGLCPDCNGLGWFERSDPLMAIRSSLHPRMVKVIVAWTVLAGMGYAHDWLGYAVRKLQQWVSS